MGRWILYSEEMNNPLVTIIIPVYNGEKYLEEAIISALEQTYKNIEVIVVNDGSDDNDATKNIACSFGSKIRYYDKLNGGVSSALNLGIEKMNGKYFSWLSHDDIYYKNKIQRQISFINNKTDNNDCILYSDFNIIDENSNVIQSIQIEDIGNDIFKYWLMTESRLNGCTLLIPAKAFQICGVFNTNLKTTQDYDL